MTSQGSDPWLSSVGAERLAKLRYSRRQLVVASLCRPRFDDREREGSVVGVGQVNRARDATRPKLLDHRMRRGVRSKRARDKRLSRFPGKRQQARWRLHSNIADRASALQTASVATWLSPNDGKSRAESSDAVKYAATSKSVILSDIQLTALLYEERDT